MKEQVQAGVMGALCGALGGVSLSGIEQLLLWGLGVGRVPLEALGPAVIWMVVLSGAYGLLGGLAGFRRGRWLLFTTVAASGYLVSGRVHGLALDRGLPGPVMAAVAVAAALLLGLVLALLIKRQGTAEAVAIGVFGPGVLLLVLNQHWLGSPLARTSILVDLALLLVSMVAVTGLWVVSTDEGWGALPLTVLGAVGGGVMLFGVPVAKAPLLPAPRATGAPIVVVVVDTLRFDRLTADSTPQLWAWGQQTRRFQQAQAGASWTLPSVATVMTGLRPGSHGAGVHDGTYNLRSSIALVPTVAEQLTEAGWTCVGVTTNPWTGAAYGFARGMAHLDERVGPGPLPLGLHAPLTLGLPTTWPAYRPADRVLSAADALRSGLGDRGWFLFVHLMDVHGPYPDPTADPVADYDRAVAALDAPLAEWLGTLPSDARVVLLSDHGEELGEVRTAERGVSPGTRHGHTLYQELLHVPLWVRGLPAGEEEGLVGLDQVAATLLEWAEVAPLGDMAPSLEKPRAAPVVSEALRFGPRTRAARLGPLKLVRWERARVVEQVFHLGEDPDEMQDRRGAFPEAEAILEQALEVVEPRAGERAPGDATTRDLLERLGYLGEGG